MDDLIDTPSILDEQDSHESFSIGREVGRSFAVKAAQKYAAPALAATHADTLTPKLQEAGLKNPEELRQKISKASEAPQGLLGHIAQGYRWADNVEAPLNEEMVKAHAAGDLDKAQLIHDTLAEARNLRQGNPEEEEKFWNKTASSAGAMAPMLKDLAVRQIGTDATLWAAEKGSKYAATKLTERAGVSVAKEAIAKGGVSMIGQFAAKFLAREGVQAATGIAETPIVGEIGAVANALWTAYDVAKLIRSGNRVAQAIKAVPVAMKMAEDGKGQFLSSMADQGLMKDVSPELVNKVGFVMGSIQALAAPNFFDKASGEAVKTVVARTVGEWAKANAKELAKSNALMLAGAGAATAAENIGENKAKDEARQKALDAGLYKSLDDALSDPKYKDLAGIDIAKNVVRTIKDSVAPTMLVSAAAHTLPAIGSNNQRKQIQSLESRSQIPRPQLDELYAKSGGDVHAYVKEVNDHISKQRIADEADKAEHAEKLKSVQDDADARRSNYESVVSSRVMSHDEIHQAMDDIAKQNGFEDDSADSTGKTSSGEDAKTAIEKYSGVKPDDLTQEHLAFHLQKQDEFADFAKAHNEEQLQNAVIALAGKVNDAHDSWVAEGITTPEQFAENAKTIAHSSVSQEVADAFGVSRKDLQREFKKAAGLTPKKEGEKTLDDLRSELAARKQKLDGKVDSISKKKSDEEATRQTIIQAATKEASKPKPKEESIRTLHSALKLNPSYEDGSPKPLDVLKTEVEQEGTRIKVEAKNKADFEAVKAAYDAGDTKPSDVRKRTGLDHSTIKQMRERLIASGDYIETADGVMHKDKASVADADKPENPMQLNHLKLDEPIYSRKWVETKDVIGNGKKVGGYSQIEWKPAKNEDGTIKYLRKQNGKDKGKVYGVVLEDKAGNQKDWLTASNITKDKIYNESDKPVNEGQSIKTTGAAEDGGGKGIEQNASGSAVGQQEPKAVGDEVASNEELAIASKLTKQEIDKQIRKFIKSKKYEEASDTQKVINNISDGLISEFQDDPELLAQIAESGKFPKEYNLSEEDIHRAFKAEGITLKRSGEISVDSIAKRILAGEKFDDGSAEKEFISANWDAIKAKGEELKAAKDAPELAARKAAAARRVAEMFGKKQAEVEKQPDETPEEKAYLDRIFGERSSRAQTGSIESPLTSKTHAVQVFSDIAKSAGGEFIRGDGKDNIGTLKIGGVSVPVVYADSLKSPEGVKASGLITLKNGEYNIKIDRQDGRVVTPPHEVGHMVFDAMVQKHKLFADHIGATLGLDLRNIEGEEKFVGMFETPESRRKLAETLRNSTPVAQRGFVRYVNALIDVVNKLFGTSFNRFGEVAKYDQFVKDLTNFSLIKDLRDSQLTDAPRASSNIFELHEKDLRMGSLGSFISTSERLLNEMVQAKDKARNPKEIISERIDRLNKESIAVGLGEIKSIDDAIRISEEAKKQREWLVKSRTVVGRARTSSSTYDVEYPNSFGAFSAAHTKGGKPDEVMKDFEKIFQENLKGKTPIRSRDIFYQNGGQTQLLHKNGYVGNPEFPRQIAGDVVANHNPKTFYGPIDEMKQKMRIRVGNWTLTLPSVLRDISPVFGDWADKKFLDAQNRQARAELFAKDALGGDDRQGIGHVSNRLFAQRSKAEKAEFVLNGKKIIDPIKINAADLYVLMRSLKNEFMRKQMLNPDAPRAKMMDQYNGQDIRIAKGTTPAELNALADKYFKDNPIQDRLLQAHNMIFDEFFKRLDAEHFAMTGEHLEKEEFYTRMFHGSDINTKPMGQRQAMQFLEDYKSIRERQGSKIGIVIRPYHYSITKPMDDSASFIGWAHPMTELRSMLGGPSGQWREALNGGKIASELGRVINERMGSGTTEELLRRSINIEGAIDINDPAAWRKSWRALQLFKLAGPSTVLKQVGAVASAPIEFGWNAFANRFGNAFAPSAEDAKISNDVFNIAEGQSLKNRITSGKTAFEEMRVGLGADMLGKFNQRFSEKALLPTRVMDQWSIRAYTLMAIDYVKNESPNLARTDYPQFLREVAKKATRAMNNIQPSGYKAYRTGLHNAGFVGEIINQFRTSPNALFNTIYRQFREARRDPDYKSASLKVVSAATAAIAMQAIYFAGVEQFLQRGKDALSMYYGSNNQKKDALQEILGATESKTNVTKFRNREPFLKQMFSRAIPNMTSQVPNLQMFEQWIRAMSSSMFGIQARYNREAQMNGMSLPTAQELTDTFNGLYEGINDLKKAKNSKEAWSANAKMIRKTSQFMTGAARSYISAGAGLATVVNPPSPSFVEHLPNWLYNEDK